VLSAKIALGFLQPLRAVDVAFMKQEELANDGRARLDMKPVRGAIEKSAARFMFGEDVHRIDRDSADAERLGILRVNGRSEEHECGGQEQSHVPVDYHGTLLSSS